MSSAPLITFKAGICDFDTSTSPPKVKPKPTPGYLYLFEEDELVHFCWRPRSASMTQPDLDLTMVPADGTFTPYEPNQSDGSKSPTNGRIFVLRFQSSTQRHFFWLQSKSQHLEGDPAWFSPRDLKLGQIVDRLLQGDEVNVEEEVANISNDQGGDGDDDDDSTSRMEDVRSERQPGTSENLSSGDPFIGDPAAEGQGPREGGADGGRAAAMPSDDAAAAVQSFLRAMQGNEALSGNGDSSPDAIFATLPDLLPTSTTIPFIDAADEALLNNLLANLPPVLFLPSHEDEPTSSLDPIPEAVSTAIEAMSLDRKREILRQVLRSPQFSQSLSSLDTAVRNGGLPAIGDALGIPIENGGFIKNGRVPKGGADAVKAFLNGIKATVEKEKTEEKEKDNMDIS